VTEPSPGPRQLYPVGSAAWCQVTIRVLRDYLGHVATEWKQAENILNELVTQRAWEHVPPGKPYGSLDALLKAELGLDSDAIRQRIRDAELAVHGGNAVPGQKGFQRADNIRSLAYGTSETYAYRRLRRDRPDLAERVDQGEMSAHAAAVEAGFRHRTATVRLDDPAATARTLQRHMSREDLTTLGRLLLSDGE
jgi:hypothetical protein